MSKRGNNKAMWEYLESVGVLANGSDIEIKAAKYAYRKKYLLNFKRKQRESKPEFTVNFSRDNGEFQRVASAAKRHNMALSGFIRLAALAYLDNSYLVPNREQIARLEQILSECLNEIKTIVHSRERYVWEREQKLESIEKRIISMETKINEIFREPPLLTNHDHKNQVA